MFLKNDSISKKVIFILFFIISTVMLLLMSFYYVFERDARYRKLKTDMNFTSERIANNCVIPLWNYDFITLESISTYTMQNENILSIKIYSDENSILNLSKNISGKIVQGELHQSLSKDSIKIEKNIILKNIPIGKCEIIYTDTALKKILKLLILQIILLTLTFESFFILVIYFSLKNFVLKPMIELEEQVSKFSDENLILNIEIKSNDEIGKLANTFKKMGTNLKEGFEQKKQQLEEIKRISQELESKNNELNYLNQNLETIVRDRTVALNESIDNLKIAQEQLIQSEKMASLGGLVAGVAHEVNTPIGICITAATFFGDETKKVEKEFANGELSKEDFESYLKSALSSSEIIDFNLRRAGDLIKSFKQVAVDQASEIERTFKVKEYLDEILCSLHPKYKRTKHKVIAECDENIAIKTFPGAFSQIISNLILNSLLHGFEGVEEGIILIKCFIEKDDFILDYSDNGIGIPKENLNRIIEPFFTTKRGQGGSGLGLSIVYNLIVSKMKGKMKYSSEKNKGVNFVFSIPIQI